MARWRMQHALSTCIWKLRTDVRAAGPCNMDMPIDMRLEMCIDMRIDKRHSPSILGPYIVMVRHSYGPIELWPYIVMTL